MSCLFNSISYFMNINQNELRQHVCNYLEQNKPIINGLDTKLILSFDGENYIDKMRMNSTWGGAIEISAICNLCNVKIIVKNLQDNKLIEFIPLDNTFNNIIYISWNGVHFEPLSLLQLNH